MKDSITAVELLHKGLEEQFATTDFDLASFLIVSKNAEVVDMSPIVKPQMSGERGTRFLFRMRSIGGSNISDLREVEMQYMNRLTTVEPLAYMTQRKQLRNMMERKIRERDNKQHRTKKRGSRK